MGGSSYALASIEKYLSGVTNSAEEDTRFKGLEIWKDKNWYTKLRAAINKAIVLTCIEEGRSFSEKGAPIDFDMECPFIYWNERKVAKQSMLIFLLTQNTSNVICSTHSAVI